MKNMKRNGRRTDILLLLSVAAASVLATIAAMPPASGPGPRDPADGRTPASATAGAGLGRSAAAPTAIPREGWRRIAVRVYREFASDRLMAVGAGVTFYALLALFPALVALVSLYGLVADLGTLSEHIGSFRGVLPPASLDFLGDQVTRIVQKSDGALGLAFAFGLVTALWSANAGAKAMFDALNVVYEEEEKRSFVRLNLTSLGFTLGGIVFLLLAFNAVVVLPIALDYIWLGALTETLVTLGRWPVLFVSVVAGLALLYRFGPSRRSPKWRWTSPGSLVAATLWIAGSLAFSWYAENLADFDKTYGSLGAVIGFMLWLWMSVVVVLLGGELNAETEHQTATDTTHGRPKPLGLRGARMADTVAD